MVVTLRADQLGVWRSDDGEPEFGLGWDEITAVCVMPATEWLPRSLTLETEYGEHLELYQQWSGYPSVVRMIEDKFGLASGVLDSSSEARFEGPVDPGYEI